MQISTTCHGQLVKGEIVRYTSSFLEVAITSPVSKISTRHLLPRTGKQYQRYEGRELELKCQELLRELYQVSRFCKTK